MSRLLVVDDNHDILNIVAEVAAQVGYGVEAVQDAKEFISAYTREKPDIVILDLVMPGMDGIELIRWMAEYGAPERVIITSGARGGEYCESAAALAHAFKVSSVATLPKPFRLAALREMLS